MGRVLPGEWAARRDARGQSIFRGKKRNAVFFPCRKPEKGAWEHFSRKSAEFFAARAEVAVERRGISSVSCYDRVSAPGAAFTRKTPLPAMQFKKETYSIQAAAYIRGLIRSGALKPGQPVREAQISEELNISRAPIREALLMLAHQGLICSEPQKGKYVRSMSAKEIYDSYVVAGILEGAAVAQSLHRWTAKEEAAFAEVVRRLDEQVNYAVHLDTLTEIDEAFHMTLLSACTNERLIELARTSCSSLAKFLYYTYWRERDLVHIETVLRGHYEEVGLRLSELVHDDMPDGEEKAGRGAKLPRAPLSFPA